MAVVRCAVLGGPLDGMFVHARPPSSYVWLSPKAGGWVMSADRRPRGLLYKTDGKTLIYVGNHEGQCENCGAWHSRQADHCTLCGAGRVVRVG
jgi:hypothetical protein